MNEFKQSVANALRYWETRRVLYNAVLTAVAAGWVILTWPHFRSVQLMGIPPGDTHPVLVTLIILAFLANVCYSAAYLVCADHSVRSAFIGAILAARFAGTMAAINEQIPSAKVAVPRAGGSHHLTP